jgi:polysaccharide pyruvyl transferase CsaB
MRAADLPVLVCGYYGEHNLGDDALLQVLLSQLPAGVVPLVTAWDRAQVGQRFGVETTDRRSLGGVLAALGHCRALVLGGGSLLQDATSFRSLLYYAALISAARLRGLPVLLWGQGLGPLRRRRSRLLVRGLLPLVTAMSWRDPTSAALASGWGFQGLLGSDPVWALAPQRTPEGAAEPEGWHGRGGAIVLCWRPVGELAAQGWQPWLAALEQLAEQADREVLWLPFHQEQDAGLLERLTREGLISDGLAARSRELRVNTPDEALALFREAGLVLAMRLHGLILAALAGSPCAALSYDPKVSAAAAEIGCPCDELARGPGPDLLQRWTACLDRPMATGTIEQSRRNARLHRQLLATLA